LIKQSNIGQLEIFEFKTLLPERFKNLTLVPINASNLVATELEEPKVNGIVLQNFGAESLIITAGTMFQGLKQSRMAFFDQIFNPGEMAEIEVLCVEEKRWSAPMQSSLYKRAPISVLAALRISNDIEKSQRAVWSSVEAFEGGAHLSETTSLPEIMERRESSMIWLPEDPRTRFTLRPETNAVAIGLWGEPLLFEAFPTHELLAAEFRGIVDSVLMDLKNLTGSRTPRDEVYNFIERATSMSQMSTERSIFQDGISVNTQAESPHLLAINHSHKIFAYA
jgi:hypothetical protein